MMKLIGPVAILLASAGVALAQGTQQSSVPSGGGYSRVEPIGRSGSPVGTPQAGMFANPTGQYVPPATRNHVIVVPQRRR